MTNENEDTRIVGFSGHARRHKGPQPHPEGPGQAGVANQARIHEASGSNEGGARRMNNPNEDTLLSLGKVQTRIMPRDAVHICVVQARVIHRLKPGQNVYFREQEGDILALPSDRHATLFPAIVDPFLPSDAVPGDRIWCFLYPKSIQKLTHNWSAPTVPEVGQDKADKALIASLRAEIDEIKNDPDYQEWMDDGCRGCY